MKERQSELVQSKSLAKHSQLKINFIMPTPPSKYSKAITSLQSKKLEVNSQLKNIRSPKTPVHDKIINSCQQFDIQIEVVEWRGDLNISQFGQKIIKMAEKVQNFRVGRAKMVNMFKAEELGDVFECLCLDEIEESEGRVRGRRVKCQIFGRLNEDQFYQIRNNNQKIELSCQIQSTSLSSQLQNMSCFEMLINFKIQTQETKIQIFHELLYLFSFNKPNISQLFAPLIPHFTNHQTSFAHQMCWLLKFSKDKHNHYAICFFSQIISKIVEEIPQSATNLTQIYQLGVILVQTLREVSKKEEGFQIFKAIQNLSTIYEGIGSRLFSEKGRELIDFTSQYLDYSIQYMLIKILKSSNIQKCNLQYMISKFLEVFHKENIKMKSGFPTKSSLNSSIFRIISEIESILAQKMNKKIGEFIENRKNLTILNELYQFEHDKNQNYEIFRTKVLVSEFKKMKIQKNLKSHEMLMEDLVRPEENGRKLVKKQMEEEFH